MMTNQKHLIIHLNLEHLHQISDGSPEFEAELLQIFLEDSFAQLDALKQAIASHDHQQVEQLAHHIRGASANVGAQLVQVAAEQIETQARHGQIDSNQDWLAELEVSLTWIRDFIIKYHNP
jgi:HPt (histidine-containing phosphotransfer) domain-containing protein